MAQSYKIFFGQLTIFITSKKALPKFRSYMLVKVNKKSDTEFIASMVKMNTIFKNVILLSNHPKETFNLFKSQFDYIKAAGGVVRNDHGEILFIFRKGKWDLPKGKIETGEKRKDAALREVMEETGLPKIKVLDILDITYHIGHVKGRTILKQTTWYEMRCRKCNELRPQLEEGITDLRWVNIYKEPQIISKTYKSLKEILQKLQNMY